MRLSFKLLALSVVLASLTKAREPQLSNDYPPPPTIWCIRLKVVYNNGFYEKVGGNKEAAIRAIDRLISGTSEVLALPGLSYTIKLSLVKVVHEQSPWRPHSFEANDVTLKKMHSNDAEVTLTLVLTDRSYTSAVHGQRVKYSSYASPKAICDYKYAPKNVLQAIVLAHRLDVDQSGYLAYLIAKVIGVREDSWIEANEGKTCNGRKGAVMTSPEPNSTHWTSCSNDQMLGLYQYYMAIRKSVHEEDPPRFCLSNDCGTPNTRQCLAKDHQVVNTASANIDEAKEVFREEEEDYLNWLAPREALWPQW